MAARRPGRTSGRDTGDDETAAGRLSDEFGVKSGQGVRGLPCAFFFDPRLSEVAQVCHLRDESRRTRVAL